MARNHFEARFSINLNPHFADTVAAAAKAGIERGVRQMVRTAARLSPYLTGHNARSITYATSWGAGSRVPGLFGDVMAGSHAAAVYTASGYGGYLEVGTSRMPARPYIRPAVEQEAQYLLRAIREEIKRRER